MNKFSPRPPRASDLPYLKAKAESGDADAQYELGRILSDGEIVSQDNAQALKWWHRAAEQGNEKAQVTLGHAYEYGGIVKQDYAEAHFWKVLTLRIRANKLLAVEQIAAVEKRVADWMKSHPTPASK
jgi:hypothetical protein